MSLEKTCTSTAPLLNHYEFNELRTSCVHSCYRATDWEWGRERSNLGVNWLIGEDAGLFDMITDYHIQTVAKV